MQIHVVQKDINNSDWLGSLEKAAEGNPDLICLGELAVSGCLYQLRDFPPLEAVLKQLGRFKSAIFIGLPRREGDDIYNSFVYYHNGDYQIYNKRNLFEPMNELEVYKSGTKPGLFETKFGRIGAAICYDLRFDEVFTDLKKAAPGLILVPAAFPRIRISHWRRLIGQRARETGATVIGINAVGADEQNEFGGSSMAVTPEGKILAQAGELDETILKLTI